VLDLAELRVGIGLVDDAVEFFNGLPDGELGPDTGFGVEALPRREVVGDGLLGVLFGIEGLDAVVGGGVLSEGGVVFGGVELGRGVEGRGVWLGLGFGLEAGFLGGGECFEDVDLVDGVGDGLEGCAGVGRVGAVDGGGGHSGFGLCSVRSTWTAGERGKLMWLAGSEKQNKATVYDGNTRDVDDGGTPTIYLSKVATFATPQRIRNQPPWEASVDVCAVCVCTYRGLHSDHPQSHPHTTPLHLPPPKLREERRVGTSHPL